MSCLTQARSSMPALALPSPEPPASSAAGAHASSAEQQHQQQLGIMTPEAQTLQPGLSAFLDGLSMEDLKRLLTEVSQEFGFSHRENS